MRTITVTGHGAASVVPDSAVVRVAAVHRAAGMADALAGAESARASIVALAGDLVVSSTSLDVWPAHDAQGQPSGFEARHSLVVRGATLEQGGELLDRLASEVGDRMTVDGVSLTVTDPTAALGQARNAAYADARARAEHLAVLADVVLGEVQQVIEGGGAAVPAARGMMEMAKADVGLQPGQLTLSADLTVTWAIA